MTPAAVTQRIRAVGGDLYVDGDELCCRAPAGVITPELRDALARNKPAILGYLRSDPVSAEEHARNLHHCLNCGRAMSIVHVAAGCGLCASMPYWRRWTPAADADPRDPRFDVWNEWKRHQAKKEPKP